MGSITGIVIMLTFVGLPFYINTVKNGIDPPLACSGLLWQTLSPTSRLLDEAIAEGREVWLEVPAAARQPVKDTR